MNLKSASMQFEIAATISREFHQQPAQPVRRLEKPYIFLVRTIRSRSIREMLPVRNPERSRACPAAGGREDVEGEALANPVVTTYSASSRWPLVKAPVSVIVARLNAQYIAVLTAHGDPPMRSGLSLDKPRSTPGRGQEVLVEKEYHHDP